MKISFYRLPGICILLLLAVANATKPNTTMKTFRITAQSGDVTIMQASSLQKAANDFFGVEKAVRCMSPDGYWANHRHSKNNPSTTAKIELA